MWLPQSWRYALEAGVWQGRADSIPVLFEFVARDLGKTKVGCTLPCMPTCHTYRDAPWPSMGLLRGAPMCTLALCRAYHAAIQLAMSGAYASAYVAKAVGISKGSSTSEDPAFT